MTVLVLHRLPHGKAAWSVEPVDRWPVVRAALDVVGEQLAPASSIAPGGVVFERCRLVPGPGLRYPWGRLDRGWIVRRSEGGAGADG